MDWPELASSPLPWGNLDVTPRPPEGNAAGVSGGTTAQPIFTRLTFRRNFADLPFVVSAPPKACAEAAERALHRLSRTGGQTIRRLADCPPAVIRMLRERNLLPGRAAAFPGKGRFKYLALAPSGEATLINEVEHFACGRFFAGSASLDDAERFPAPAEEDASRSPWAWSSAFGYLASNPAHVGPGFEAQWLLHLPALMLSRRLQQALNFLAASGVGIMPAYARMQGATQTANVEPARDDSALFLIHSRGGLGKTPREVYRNFMEAVQPALRWEEETRNMLAEKHRKRLEDRVRGSLAHLSGARSLPYSELLASGSYARLGAYLGMLGPEIPAILEELRVRAATGHLTVSCGRELSQEDEDFMRASVVRSWLEKRGGGPP